MDVSVGVVSAAAASVGVPIVFGLLRQLKTLQPEKETHKSFSLLKRLYRKWEVFSLVPLFVFTPAIGLLLWLFLKGIADLLASRMGESVYYLGPAQEMWAIPALFVSIFIAVVPMHFLYLSILGRRRYQEYTEYTNLRSGLDGFRLLKYMSYLFIPLCVGFSMLGFDAYIRVTPEKIISNDFLSIGERDYYFDEISRIDLVKSFEASNGRIVRRPFYSIAFSDDYMISFRRSYTEASLEEQEEIVSYLVEMFGIEVKVGDAYPRSRGNGATL